MKTCIFVIVCLSVGLSMPTFSQVDSLLEYYPLNLGDVWQYHYHYPWTPDSVSTYYFVRIIGDTLMPNGKWYKIFDRTADEVLSCSYCLYRRVDSSTACVYGYQEWPSPSELLLDSLGASPGDTFGEIPLPGECLSFDSMEVLGVPSTAKEFAFYILPEYPRLTFARGFGLVHRVDFDAFSYFPHAIYNDLQYARIAGREFGTIVDVHPQALDVPEQFVLHQNYPNPFNPTTTIRYELRSGSFVNISVYNLLGQRLLTVVNGYKPPGNHAVMVDLSEFAAGLYIYRMKAEEFSAMKRMILLK
jgi:hypothetical protein